MTVEENRQVEAGLRFDIEPLNLSGSFAVYDLERLDTVVFGPGGLEIIDQNSRGFEVDLIWQPTEALSVIANYANTDARVEGGAFDGNRLQRVPENSGRVALRYDFLAGPLEGLGLGAGVTAVSEQAGDLGNSFFTEGYATVDAQASYQRGPVTAELAVDNLFNRDAFVPNFYFQGNTAPLTPLTVSARLRLEF